MNQAAVGKWWEFWVRGVNNKLPSWSFLDARACMQLPRHRPAERLALFHARSEAAAVDLEQSSLPYKGRPGMGVAALQGCAGWFEHGGLA